MSEELAGAVITILSVLMIGLFLIAMAKVAGLYEDEP